MFDIFWNIAAFIIAIGILITFHEYGHYWVAKLCDVKVLRFSIGFGKPIWKKTNKDGTEFILAQIPLGGYVKMLDERVDDVNIDDKDKTFNSKSVLQRIAIISAGPLANFLLAIVAFVFVFLIGKTEIKPIIGQIETGSIAEIAALPINQQIIKINNREVATWQDIQLALMAEMDSESIIIKTKKINSQYASEYFLDTSNWNFEPNNISAMASLGIQGYRPEGSCEIIKIAENSPASRAGLLKHDVIVSINDVLVSDNCNNFNESIQLLPDQQIKMTVLRNNKLTSLVADIASKKYQGKVIGYLGVARKHQPIPQAYKNVISYSFFESITKGVEKTWQVTNLSFDMLIRLFTGNISLNNLSGPIGIAQGAGQSASIGIVYFLGFIAFFSINLGIFNLLPLPVLDGGHLLYYFIELLTGKPVPEKVQELGFKFGAVLLFSLMAFAILNDISRL